MSDSHGVFVWHREGCLEIRRVIESSLISLLVISVDLSKSVLFAFSESVTDCGLETEP